MEKTLKKQEIMLLNTLLCIIVVFIHCASHPVSSFVKPSTAYTLIFVPWRLAAFVVQGFIFLSGLKLFLKPIESFNYKNFIIKRLKLIFLPYVAAVFIYYIYFISIGYFPFRIKDFVFYVLTGSLVSPFYFIVAIMQFYILMPLWIKMTEKINFPVAIIISFIVMLIAKYYVPQILQNFPSIASYNDRVFTTYIIYWVFGCYAGKYYSHVREKLGFLMPVFFLTFIFSAFADVYFTYQTFVYGIYHGFLENLHMVYCIFAILFLFSLFIKIGNVHIPFLKQLDSISFNIYLFHCLVIFITNGLMARLGINSITMQFLIRAFMAYFVTITMCLVYKKLKSLILNKLHS